jgi:CRP-like cAMP-binding protein
MAQRIYVTDAQVKAARMLVDRDRALGRETDEATRIIADQDLGADPSATPGRQRRPDHSWEAVAAQPGTGFWTALDAEQRRQLMSAGTWRTFPADDVLMREGDPADHVIVIMGGRAKISVNRNGRERVLAVRGVGELIGERAAHDVSVRTATVTAIELIWALMVQTRDFAAFAGKHPRVVNMIQDQMWKRLTEGLPEPGPSGGGWHRLFGKLVRARSAAGNVAARPPRGRPGTLVGENYTILLSDVVGSGAGARTGNDRAVIRDALHVMMNAALKGLETRTEDRGDGFLTVLPPAVLTDEVMRRVLAELPAALEQHNRNQRASLQFQLRLAVNVGPVSADPGGVSGEAVIIAHRLLDDPDFKQATSGRGKKTSLGVIISPFVYETVVRPDQDLTEVASYTQVPVKVKDSNTTAWVRWISPDPVPA